MAIIKPLKAYRPTSDLVDKVVSLPYDVLDSEEARETVKGNPYSFLHVIKAEIDLEPSVNVYDSQVYEKARDNLNSMIAGGVFIQDKKPQFYIYKEVMAHQEQVGLVTCTAVDDYLHGVIKVHEFTRPDKEQDRMKYIDYCNANTGLIFLTYRPKNAVNILVNSWMNEHVPIYDFSTDDGVRHAVWAIDDNKVIDNFVHEFAQIKELYVADGHHRTASAAKVSQMRRKQYPNYSGEEAFNYFLSVLIPSDQLHIMDYNRVVKDLNGLSEQEFLNKVEEKFEIQLYTGKRQYKPDKHHVFGMYLEGKWYTLTAKPGTYDADDPIKRLDAAMLQNNLLAPVLGIENPKTDTRIDFVGGIRGLEELERRVFRGMKVAFALYPKDIDDVLAIVDAGETMPPKSTWFEPKLRSGLFVHKLF